MTLFNLWKIYPKMSDWQWIFWYSLYFKYNRHSELLNIHWWPLGSNLNKHKNNNVHSWTRNNTDTAKVPLLYHSSEQSSFLSSIKNVLTGLNTTDAVIHHWKNWVDLFLEGRIHQQRPILKVWMHHNQLTMINTDRCARSQLPGAMEGRTAKHMVDTSCCLSYTWSPRVLVHIMLINTSGSTVFLSWARMQSWNFYFQVSANIPLVRSLWRNVRKFHLEICNQHLI